MSRKVSHAHWRVATLAKEMAHEVYDELMKRNDWYSTWKNAHPGASSKGLETIWVKNNWPKFVEGARATLAGMLAKPYDEDLKNSIYEALIDDSTLVRGRKNPQLVLN